MQEYDTKAIIPGRIFKKPLNFFHPDYPDPMVLKALQYFDIANSQEMGQVTFAANNRVDSRKTAKEISSSEQQQQLLNSVQLTLFSTHIRGQYNLVWLIVQSQAMQGLIKFCQIKTQKPVINPVTNQPLPDPDTQQPQMQDVWENDFDTISQIYDIRAAGDVDVIQKQEKVQQMKQDWPVISTTVLKDTFLAELIRLEYPDTGEKWAKILETQGNQFSQMQQMIMGLSHIVIGIFKDNPQIMQTLSPDEQNSIKQLLTQSQQLAGPAGATPPP